MSDKFTPAIGVAMTLLGIVGFVGGCVTCAISDSTVKSLEDTFTSGRNSDTFFPSEQPPALINEWADAKSRRGGAQFVTVLSGILVIAGSFIGRLKDPAKIDTEKES